MNRIKSEKRRNVFLTMRMTNDQRELFYAAARRAGLSGSDFLISIINKELKIKNKPIQNPSVTKNP